MSIPLPPLPEPTGYDDRHTEDQLRARDLEIARVVLEAAAKEMRACAQGIVADLLDVESHRRVLAAEQRIRALEFKHDSAKV